MSLHSILALWEPGIGDPEDAPDGIELLIFFTFDPGYREVGPSYASGGEPGQPPTVELDHVEREIDGKWIETREFDDWAVQWLDGVGHDKAIDQALDGPDEAPSLWDGLRDRWVTAGPPGDWKPVRGEEP